MKIGLLACGIAAGLCTSTFAGFVGWTAKIQDTGSYYVMNVFAGMESTSDKLLNVFNMNITASGTTFYQLAGVANSKWKPIDDTSNTETVDSFVTLGSFDGGDGHQYSSYSTAGDPNFTNYTTANQTTIPANAGWYNGVPTVSDIFAQSLSSFAGDTVAGGASASYGVLVAHFAFAKSGTTGSANVSFAGRGAFNTGTNLLDSRVFAVGPVPAPGALALLGLAGVASRRRRA
jgi:MYXO-CTERM domain-containing protein